MFIQYVYHQEANWGRTFMRLQVKFNIYHKNPLVSQALAFYTTKQGKQAANSFITFNTLAHSRLGWGGGGHWHQRFFGQRNFQKMSVGVLLLGMVPEPDPEGYSECP